MPLSVKFFALTYSVCQVVTPATGTAYSTAALPIPIEPAASRTRAMSKTRISPLKPAPSSPSLRSSGTKHSSKASSPAGKQRQPSFGSRGPTM